MSAFKINNMKNLQLVLISFLIIFNSFSQESDKTLKSVEIIKQQRQANLKH